MNKPELTKLEYFAAQLAPRLILRSGIERGARDAVQAAQELVALLDAVQAKK